MCLHIYPPVSKGNTLPFKIIAPIKPNLRDIITGKETQINLSYEKCFVILCRRERNFQKSILESNVCTEAEGIPGLQIHL